MRLTGGVPAWSRRALLVVLAAAVVFGAVRDRDDGTSGELRRRLDAAPATTAFAFEHRPGGTQVLECAFPNRVVRGVVDLAAREAVLEVEGDVVASRRPDQVLLAPALFAPGLLGGSWLRVPLPVEDPRRERIDAVLGPVLAPYALAEELPAGGRETALAALEAADEVQRLDAVHLGGRRADRYRVVVGADAFGEAGGVDADGAAVPPPVVEVWLDADDAVVRVVVEPTRPDGSPGAPESGWTVDYGPAPPLDWREPAGVVDLEDLRRPVAPATGDGDCNLEI